VIPVLARAGIWRAAAAPADAEAGAGGGIGSITITPLGARVLAEWAAEAPAGDPPPPFDEILSAADEEAPARPPRPRRKRAAE
jgi:hypothetical protein